MDRLVRHGQIIAQVATGGGKSRIAMLCQARINRPTLFFNNPFDSDVSDERCIRSDSCMFGHW
ncbi:hypothetical protein [Acinetobacter baumannii]|uniref:hypothetical protein n=1 Tax=Acinetobacter baumannii TaxID=470 RepID=UPI003D03D8C9